MTQWEGILNRHANLPDLWGEGAIFAFSGLDGETNAASGFVGTYGREPYQVLLHTPRRRILEVRPVAPGRARVATGDVVAVEVPGGLLVQAWAAWHTLIGMAPEGTALALRMEDGPAAEWQDDAAVSADAEHGEALALARAGERFALAYGTTAEQALGRARAGLAADLAATVEARLAFYGRTPSLADPGLGRLLNKCWSVIKVNALSPEGVIRQRWSTPDRVPHRDMWLWDSVFHTLAVNRLDPQLAWEYLKSVLDGQGEDGMIAHQHRVNGWRSRITQPPLLGWGVWENYGYLRSKEALEYALPRLERYLEWDLAHRDADGNGLVEWLREGDTRCRSGESGLDNSPRFDNGLPADDVDFSTFLAEDMRYTGLIARELGDEARGQAWLRRAAETSAKVHALLWDERAGFYCDRYLSGGHSPVRAVSGFMPLLLADIPAPHVDGLLRALRDPAQFGTAFPIPTVAVSDPSWSTDMWRGATWANMNYLAIRGLRQQGQLGAARELAQRTVEHVGKYYERFGAIFEFFDAKDQLPPTQCDRKGPHQEPYNIRRKMDSIRDYQWTAAVTAALLLEGAG
ncbi:MAG: hypothetical protein GXY76_21440 [Chloroflexi bacterium]|nr:hypothetical protein [Chloroflexota bacterium]